jgi:hypothetical protein
MAYEGNDEWWAHLIGGFAGRHDVRDTRRTHNVVYGVPSKRPLISTSATSVDDRDARSWMVEYKRINRSVDIYVE